MSINRRDFLSSSYIGLGGLALEHLMASESTNPMRPKPQHTPAKAKRCIFLFMEGGVSQMYLFEYKPALNKFAGKQIPKPTGTVGEIATFSAAPNRVIPSPITIAQHRQTRRWITELMPNFANR